MLALRLLVAVIVCPLLATAQAKVILANPVDVLRKEEVVGIPWKEIAAVFPAIDTAAFRVISLPGKADVPLQLLKNQDGQPKTLLVQVTIAASSALVLQVLPGTRKPVKPKVYCRYVPERKDDFAWENDKIAFRAYGAALEATPAENAYGLDVWVKRTAELVIDKRYKGGDYHKDHGDGLDYYHVGYTLGAGQLMPYVKDSVWYSANYRRWKIIANGPLRAIFQLEYDDWPVDAEAVSATRTITIDAGTQLHRVDVVFRTNKQQPMPVVAGIITRDKPGVIQLDEQKKFLAYWEPAEGDNGTTGVACYFPGQTPHLVPGNHQVLARIEAETGTTLTYYRGAAWNKAGEITSSNQWFQYLAAYSLKMENPVRITVSKTN